MNKLNIPSILILCSFLIISCTQKQEKEETQQEDAIQTIGIEDFTFEIDSAKRNHLVKKYDLLNFFNKTEPVFLSVEEFFDGNRDDASIAPNLNEKLPIADYHRIIKSIADDPKTTAAFVEIRDVMIYDDSQLADNEWFYTDVVYLVGKLSKEQVAKRVRSLKPDAVEYANAVTDVNYELLKKAYPKKKIVYIWWD